MNTDTNQSRRVEAVELLPCPFCRQPAKRNDEFSYLTSCSNRDCFMSVYVIDVENWQDRAAETRGNSVAAGLTAAQMIANLNQQLKQRDELLREAVATLQNMRAVAVDNARDQKQLLSAEVAEVYGECDDILDRARAQGFEVK